MSNSTSHIDQNRIFLVNRSELAERFDPDMVLYSRKTKSFLYEAVPLKALLKKQPQYGANESGIERITETEPRYIRITDINEYGLLNDTIGVTAERIESKYILNNNDILFARSGATVGKAYLHKSESVDYECFFAGYMIRFVIDEKKILPTYLFTYTQLSPYKDWVKAIQRAAGQPNINAEEYKSLSVPLPSIKVQAKIVEIIDEAYLHKKQKEAEAKALLESIDTYILKELGISLPEQNNSLHDRIFTTMFSEVVGVRFDPFYFKHFGRNTKSHLYEEVSLKSIASVVKGQSITKDKVIEGDYPVVAGGQSSPYSHNIYNQEPHAITVSASGAYAGYVWLHTQKIFASDCSVIRSKNEKEVTTEFIYNVLKAKQAEIYRMQQGAGQPHVYSRDLEKLLIPLPSPAKQTEINKHIQKIKNQIDALQNKAYSILEEAKQAVEQMIIGN